MLNLNDWLRATAWDKDYWQRVALRAEQLNSDGCTVVADWFVWTCYEHDIHYRTHRFLDGNPIDRRTADYILMRRIMQVRVEWRKPLTWFKHLLALDRWLGVRFFGYAHW